MSTSRNRLNLLAPVEPARKIAAEEVITEPEPECRPQFRFFYWHHISNYLQYIA